jgi:uncharacterized repeat protein (TIGR01451 family)
MNIVGQKVTTRAALDDCALLKWLQVGKCLRNCAAALIALGLYSAALAAPDFNITSYNYDNQPTPLPTSGTTTFRVSVGSADDAPTPGSPVKISIEVPAGVEAVPGSFPSYCVLKNNAPISGGASGNQILQCTLPDGSLGAAGTSEEISYVGRAVQPGASAYAMNACIDDTLAAVAAYPISTANCQNYPGDTNTGNDLNGSTILINAANDLGISFDPVANENVIAGSAYTFTAKLTSSGLDPIPGGQVQADFNLQPGFIPASSAAITAASPGWNCTLVGSKVTCILASATGVAANPLGNTVNLPDIKIPGVISGAAGGSTISIDGAVGSNDTTAPIADPKPSNNGPVLKSLVVQTGGNVKADKSFAGQPGSANATLALTGVSTVRLSVAVDAGGAPMPAGAIVLDDLTDMVAKGFVVGTLPAGCSITTNVVSCTAPAISAGGAASFLIPLTNPLSLPALPSGINTAQVTPAAGYADSNPADNTKTAAYTVVPAYADLEIFPQEAARKVPLGGLITRGVTVRNNGPIAASYGGANPPLRAYGSIAINETTAGGTGIPTCPTTLSAPWVNCTVQTLAGSSRLVFDTGATVGVLLPGASTVPATFTSTAPLIGVGTGPNTQVCTGQKILDQLSLVPNAGPNPPERTGINGVNGPATEFNNDCKSARGVEYIDSTQSAGDLAITKTVATLTGAQACDASASFASSQTLASVASNDNALCFRMQVRNQPISGATWGTPGVYTHGPAQDYFISDTLPMYWGISGTAGENLPTPRTITLDPPLSAGENCNASDLTASPPLVRCDLKNLAANATRIMYVKVSRGMFDGTFVNTALVDSKNLLEPEDVPGSSGFANNAATATSVINPVVDLQVTGKSISPNPIPVGKLGQYVFTYRNLGPNPSQAALVEDIIDTDRWEIVGTPLNTRGDVCSLVLVSSVPSRTAVRCLLAAGQLERQQEFQVVIRVRPKFPYAQPNNSSDGFSDGVGSPGYLQGASGLQLNTAVSNMPGYSNSASITATRVIETERSLTNNSSVVLVKVAPPRFDLIVSKTDVGSGLNGDNLLFSQPTPGQVTYRVNLVNSGESKITGVFMVDLKPVLSNSSVPNFGTNTAVSNNGIPRTLNLVGAVFEGQNGTPLAGRTAPIAGIGTGNTCVDGVPLLGMIRCEMSGTAADRFVLPGENISWKLTFDVTPASTIRGNLTLPNKVRGASNEAPFDMTVAGNVDYDKDSVRNATENTTWFAPTDLAITSKVTDTPQPMNLNQTASFTINFANNGPSPIRKVKIIEQLPPGFTFVSASFVQPAGSSLPGVAANYPVVCSGVGANVATCEIGDVNAAVADFPGTGGTQGQLVVVAKASDWAAIQAAGFSPSTLNNVATIEPGNDPVNDKPLGKDTVSINNAGTSTVSVIKTSISGKVCQVTQGTSQADAATKNCTGPSPIAGTTIKICGVDLFGSAIGGGAPGGTLGATGGNDCGNATVSKATNATGDWEILVPPGTAYTIVETQPAGFSDYTEQAGTAGGVVVTGPQTAATNSGLNFGASPNENKITTVPVSAAGGAAGNPTGYNFTEIVNTGLSGVVYEDLNNNGKQDIGESGIEGVVITLTGTDFDGNPLPVGTTATTNSNGQYSFSVPPSNPAGYTLTQVQPAGYFDGKEIKGDTTSAQPLVSVIAGSEANSSALLYTAGGVAPGTNNIATDVIGGIVLSETAAQSQHNFGEIKTGTITGVIYVDSNGSVSKGGAEASLPNVTVTLSGTDYLGNPVSRAVLSNGSGLYEFGGLLPGDYTVTEAPVPGYTHTGASVEGPNTALGVTYAPRTSNNPTIIPAAGAAAGGVTAPSINLIKLGPGGRSDGNNFGERGSDLSGSVCEDLNNDGVCQPTEPPIPNVTITLVGIDAAGNAITRTAITSATGSWVINDLPAPNITGYTLEESQPSAYLDGKQSPGTLASYAGANSAPAAGITTPLDTTTPAKDRVTGIKFDVATKGINYDFAEVKSASLQGFVYLDVTVDGTRTVGVDIGLPGVTLELKGMDDMGQSVLLTTTVSVSPDGAYSFNNLRPGTYEVREIQPITPSVFDGTVTIGAVGYVSAPTAPTVANNGTLISEDASIASGSGEGVAGIVLGSGGAGTNYNFGEVPRLSIAGRVILDADRSGGITGAETNIPGLTTTITLCRDTSNPCTNVAATTVTSGVTGAYQFNDLTPGTYYVLEDQPLAYASTSANTIPVTLTTSNAIGKNFFETGADISGTVYSDNDASGNLAGSDTGINLVSMKLCLTSSLPACASPVATASTSPTGSYTFANVPAPPALDSYVIVENETTGPLLAFNNGTATIGTLTGSAMSVSGAILLSEQGVSFTGDSLIRAISFVMPTAVTTGSAPVIGLGYNFGEIPLAGISGKVFVDRDFANLPGIFNATTDTPLNTVTMTLCSATPVAGVCPSINIVATTTTSVTGDYSFSNVPAGLYTVIETQPYGYGSSSPNEIQVTRSGNTSVADINFGDTLAEIKGRVYQDNNGNGGFDTGTDPGIGGVTVQICRSSDASCLNPIQTTLTTAVSGTYTFANLPVPPIGETYFIKEGAVPVGLNNGTTTVGDLAVSGGSLSPVGTANSPGSVISNITWTPTVAPFTGLAAVGANYNFGELPVTSVSGTVFLDRDYGGGLTAIDTGLPVGTTVTLCLSPANPCSSGNTVATTISTPGSGTYTFPGITPGTYYAVQTQPPRYASSSPNISVPINVTSTAKTGYDFFETGANLSGIVFKDTDYSGVYSSVSTDVLLAGVSVKLCTTNNCLAGSVVASATTTVAGFYEFRDLPAPLPGQPYFIVEDQLTVPPSPTTLGDGTSTVGSYATTGGATTGAPTVVQTPSRFENITWVPATAVVTGAPSVAGSNFNFGEIVGFDIGGRVYFDKNRNGVQSGPEDVGLNGVVITLCRASGVPCLGTNIAGTTTTNISGDYTFPQVPPGSYFMQETQPLGYGSVPTTTAPAVTDIRPVTVAGAPISGIDFADTLSSIAGLVYRDDNGSQARDGAEPTMPAGITITLTGVDASGGQVNTTTLTTSAGSYVFENLKTGTYTITESQLPAFGTGGANPGTLAAGSGGPNSNVITNVLLPVNTDAPNYNFGDTPKTAGVAGNIWRDNDHDRLRDVGEPPLVGWTVEILRAPSGGGTPTVVTSVQTGSNGEYSVSGLEAGGGYSIRFKAPGGAVFGGAVDGEQGTPVSGASIVRGEISSLTLTASVTGGPNIIPQQSLPVDPSGVVYDSDTRLPVPGAQVTFVPVACPAFNPANDLVGGAGNLVQTVGPDGFYQFLLNPTAPACQYRLVVTPPATYTLDPAIPPQPGSFTPPNRPPNIVEQIVPNPAAPTAGQPTTYFLSFNLNSNSRDVVNNHIPLISGNRPLLFITKQVSKPKAELGDTVKYTVRVRYAGGAVNLPTLTVVDTMPAGFKLIPETSYVSVPATAPAVQLPASRIAGAPGAVVTYDIPLPAGGFAIGAEIELTYRVRIAVGSMQGDGINRAQARSIGVVRSNTAQAKVIVEPGVFTNDACVAGKVFVDCNNNHIQDAEELGVPGVRLYIEDGTYFITDSEGKYSYCGISPKSHVIGVDMLTMPRGSRMTTTTNRNLGDGNSIFLDTKNGQLLRGDFAEGSCSNTVLEQVKRRRTQGEVRSTETEKTGQPALKFEGKSPQYPQQGTDSANQPLVVPRPPNGGTPSTPEQNTPVPKMPGASSNTQGANVRNAP